MTKCCGSLTRLQLPPMSALGFIITISQQVCSAVHLRNDVRELQEQANLPLHMDSREDQKLGRSLGTAAPFSAADYTNDGKKHLLLAASGSVATIKLPNIVEALSDHHDLSIRIIVTDSAGKFLTGQSKEQPTLQSLSAYPNVDGIYRDEDEWKKPWIRGDPILHIELRRWSDLMVVAPLSANSMAKMTVGIADNLLLSVIRAWDTTGELDGKRKRIVVAPAMNTGYYRQPITRKQLTILEDDWGVGGPSQEGWVEVLRPIEKTLACGDVGDGAMHDWKDIVSVIEERLDLSTHGHVSSSIEACI